MAPPSRRNDRRPAPFRPARTAPPPRKSELRGDWLWGWHTVLAALENPSRQAPRRLVATQERARAMLALPGPATRIEVMDNREISALLPPGAVHQGVAVDVSPLDPATLAQMATPANGVILMLDQVTDPQNVGAIFRSAAALGARGIVLQERNAPHLAGALAKAAAGAIDRIAHARETNLSRALELLDRLGWRAVGLDGEAEETLQSVLDFRPTVIVVGSEGEGLRRLVREHCDALARIPMSGGFESLNVAAAAAIALYEASRGR